jgi:CelD/BcsL family acetyltransferase involved in cellulose biosynthesis
VEYTIYNEFSDALKADWNGLLSQSSPHVPFLRYEYLHAWWQHRGGGEWPEDAQLCIIVGHEAGRITGVAPCFSAIHKGSKRLLLLGSIEISDYLDVISKDEDRPRFLRGLLEFVRSCPGSLGDVTTLDFYNILEDSPTVPFFKSVPGAELEVLQHSPYIKLPGDWEVYLAGIDKKQRHEIRRKMRRAAESEVPVEVYFTTEADALEADMEAFLGLMAQDEEKAAFLTPPMREQMKATMRVAFEGHVLQLIFLKIRGEFAAGYFNADYLNRIWVYNSGLDRRFTEYSPGWVLLGHLLQWANENKREELDFMRGDEEYKYRFGAEDRHIVRVTMKL